MTAMRWRMITEREYNNAIKMGWEVYVDHYGFYMLCKDVDANMVNMPFDKVPMPA